MSPTCNKNKIKSLNNKNNIYHGVILFLTVFLFLLRSPQAAVADSGEKSQSDTPDTTELEQDKAPVFGTKGQKRWYLQGAAATTLDDNESDPRRFGLVGAGLSQFFINGHSVNLELNSIYFNQPGDDALGLNLALIMRWHFVRQQNWSLYIDGGAGILGTTNDVPIDAASFNFTPQVGGGATIGLQDQKRLMLGLRWHHISHADLFDNNPGRDSIMGYVGLNFSR